MVVSVKARQCHAEEGYNALPWHRWMSERRKALVELGSAVSVRTGRSWRRGCRYKKRAVAGREGQTGRTNRGR